MDALDDQVRPAVGNDLGFGPSVPNIPTVSGSVFTMPDGRRCPLYVVSQGINRHLDTLGIPLTAHALRHWFGTNLYQSSQDIVLAQWLLGHSSVATTQICADCDQTNGAPAVAALSIRADTIRPA